MLGCSVAGAGDVNGDGYADVIVGRRPTTTPGRPTRARPSCSSAAPAGIADGNPADGRTRSSSRTRPSAQLGDSVAGGGRRERRRLRRRDRRARHFYDAGETDEGAAFVFLGGAAGIADGNPATAAAQLESDQAGAQLGCSVAGAGDVNGDGYADVIVGAPLYDAGQTRRGRGLRVPRQRRRGSPTAIPRRPPRSSSRTRPARASAASVAGAGDVNGDGYADVIVGRPLLRRGPDRRGRGVRVPRQRRRASRDGNPATAAAQLESDQASAQLGYSVAGGRRRERRRLRRRDRRAPICYDAGQSERGRGVRLPRQRGGHRGRQPRDRGRAARVEPGRRAVWAAAWPAPAT